MRKLQPKKKYRKQFMSVLLSAALVMQNGVPVLAESESQLGTEDESEEAEGKKAASEDTDGDSEEKSAADADSNEEKNTAEERSSNENADESADDEKSAAEETSTENAGDEKISAEESAEEKNSNVESAEDKSSNEESSNEESSEEKSSIEESSKEESADKESSTESSSDEKGSTEESTEEKESSTEENTTEVTSETESGTEETATEETTEEEEEKNLAESTNAEGGNILANGSFENVSTKDGIKWTNNTFPSGFDDGYIWEATQGEGMSFSIEDSTEAKDGGKVFHVVSTSKTPRWSFKQANIQIDTNKKYECTFWIKTDNVETDNGGIYLRMTQMIPGTGTGKNVISEKIKGTTNGWVQYRFTTEELPLVTGNLLQFEVFS